MGRGDAMSRRVHAVTVGQRSDCSISSSCLSRSANSIVSRRNCCATAARRRSSCARRSSRPASCASVSMVVASGGLAVKVSTTAVCGRCVDRPAPAATDSTTDRQPTRTRDQHYRRANGPTGSAVSRRAWFSVPWSAGSGTTGLRTVASTATSRGESRKSVAVGGVKEGRV